MSAERLEDYALMEKNVLAFFGALAVSVATELSASFPSSTNEERRDAIERVLWSVAAHLEERNVGNMKDGRAIRPSLGFIAVGSQSAFEVPFIEHEGVLAASRIVLHEFVREAIERALDSARRVQPPGPGEVEQRDRTGRLRQALPSRACRACGTSRQGIE